MGKRERCRPELSVKMTKKKERDKATHGKIIMTAKKRKGKWINGPQHEQWKTTEKIMQKIITDQNREAVNGIINSLSEQVLT